LKLQNVSATWGYTIRIFIHLSPMSYLLVTLTGIKRVAYRISGNKPKGGLRYNGRRDNKKWELRK
jgi:hypothetical protein